MALFSCGSHHLDWAEIWCNRCAKDRGWHNGVESVSCETAADLVALNPNPAFAEGAYTVHMADGETQHIPASPDHWLGVTCSEWTPCVTECMQHPNGAVITGITVKAKDDD